MSGQDGMRGYLLQALCVVLEALGRDDWDSVQIEPDIDAEKVDVLWLAGKKRTAQQIKSSRRQIGLAAAERWAAELQGSFPADDSLETRYELVLLGPASGPLCSRDKLGEVHVPTPKTLSLPALIQQAAHLLDGYLTKRGYSPVPPFVREFLVEALLARLAEYSTNGTSVAREDLETLIQQWLLSVYPGAVNCAVDEQLVALWSSIVIVSEEMRNSARHLVLPLTFVNDGTRTAVIEWLALQVLAKVGSSTRLYRPRYLTNRPPMELRRIGAGIVTGESVLDRPFSEFAVLAHSEKTLTVIFMQAEAQGYLAEPLVPGEYEFRLIGKTRARDLPRRLKTHEHVTVPSGQSFAAVGLGHPLALAGEPEIPL